MVHFPMTVIRTGFFPVMFIPLTLLCHFGNYSLVAIMFILARFTSFLAIFINYCFYFHPIFHYSLYFSSFYVCSHSSFYLFLFPSSFSFLLFFSTFLSFYLTSFVGFLSFHLPSSGVDVLLASWSLLFRRRFKLSCAFWILEIERENERVGERERAEGVIILAQNPRSLFQKATPFLLVEPTFLSHLFILSNM